MMKRNVIVSIFPTYQCSLNCNFCYLYNRHDKTLLDLDILKQRLTQLSTYYNIHKFNLYGGEITLLDTQYLVELNNILDAFPVDNYITSNFYDINKLQIFKNAKISTSLNKERTDYEYIRNLLKKRVIGKGVSVLSMITPSIINTNPLDVLLEYNDLNLTYLSFIKYYPSIKTGDVFNISHHVYQNTLKELVKCYYDNRSLFDYELGTITGLDAALSRDYPIATNDQCIRISPEGKFGAIYYDENNLEDFVWYDDLIQYEYDCEIEKQEYLNKCGFCKYYGNCWTEHITREKCDGCKELLDWWSTYKYE